jgi:aminomethyltransferase
MSHEKNLLRSPLDAFHRAHGARMTEFAGWEMPLQFTGIVEEHLAVRQTAGLFDISHMGQIEVAGDDAFEDLERIATKSLSTVQAGRAVYSLLCNEEGGILDDIIIYRKAENRFFLIVNGVNAAKDYAWLRANCRKSTTVENLSGRRALLAVQGPNSAGIVGQLVRTPLEDLRYFRFREDEMCGAPVTLARTGYTGEDGFEISVEAKQSLTLCEGLMDAGKRFGMTLAGLGARDTLRLEMAYPLYGMEMSETVSPFEADLGKAVSLEKGDFIGRDAIVRRRKESGRTLVGLEMLEKAVPRHSFLLKSCDTDVGRITSGAFSPSLGRGIALASVKKEFSEIGTILDVQIREKDRSAIVVATPFVTPRVYVHPAPASQ